MNCRIHGGEGTWAPLSEAAVGYSAVSAAIDAAIDPAAFAALPATPSHFDAHAMEAKLRCPRDGYLVAITKKRMSAIRNLPSYRTEMLTVTVRRVRARVTAESIIPTTPAWHLMWHLTASGGI